MTMQLSAAAQVLNGRQLGEDVQFTGISTDTRTLVAGNLFVALRGPRFDGHRYLDQARRQGAAAVAVSQSVTADLPRLEVEDTRLALGGLASHWRSRFDLPLVAVTGSNGKTSVKEMLAAILQRCGQTLVTEGNFNNDIGVPHTLFRLGPEHDYAVLELGANHPGEIAYLTSLVKPQVAVINNAGPAHLEGFGSLEGVARAKGELFDSAGPEVICVLNADDPYAALWRTLAAPRKVLSFGLQLSAEVSADWQGDIDASEIHLQTPYGKVTTRLALPGRHNVMNALAATAAALALGVGLADIAAGLAAVQPVQGRWQALRASGGARIINDTYNANPASLEAGLALLSGAPGERWLVLGDMGELGDSDRQLHSDTGAAARRAGIERLFTLGALAGLAAETFGEGASAYTNLDELLVALRAALHPEVSVLVKGSRSMHMERVVDALTGADDSSRGAG